MSKLTLRDKAEAEMSIRAAEYNLFFSHLSRTVGFDVVQDLAAEGMGKFARVIDNVRTQRESGVAPEQLLDLDKLGLTEAQKAKALEHQAERARLLNAVAQELNPRDVMSETASMRAAGLDVDGEGHGRRKLVGGVEPLGGRVNNAGQGNGRAAS